MITINFNGKEVVLEVSHGSISCVDSFADSGYYLHNGQDLTDEELDEINNNYCDEIQSFSYQESLENGNYIFSD